jgi:hypothetical protein
VSYGPGNFAPVWQQSPAPHDTDIINYDLLSHPTFQRIYHGVWETGKPVLSEVTDLSFLYSSAVKDEVEHPHSFLLDPIYPTFRSEMPDRDSLVGFLVAILPWDSYFSNLLPQGVNGIVVVLHNTCGNHFTYKINGPEAIYMGVGDLHDTGYDHMEIDTLFAPFLDHSFSDTYDHCEYDLRVFPSAELESEYTSNKPLIYTLVVLAVFCFTAMVFAAYDHAVNTRQDVVMAKAKRTNAIVSSMFPANVRDRILKDAEQQAERDTKGKTVFGSNAPKRQLKDFLNEDEANAELLSPHGSKPIADLFPAATVR